MSNTAMFRSLPARQQQTRLHGFEVLPSGLLVPERFARPQAPANPAPEVLVNHETAFPDESSEFAEFKAIVRGLSRTDSLIWCARLNILVSDSTRDSRDVQGYCIGRFFTKDTIDRINEFARDHGGRERCTVFFRGQLLELMRWIALLSIDQVDDGETFNAPEVRRLFARAALLASDLWQRRIYGDRLNDSESIDETRRAVLGAIRLSSMESESSGHPLFSIARGYSLFADRLLARAPEAEEIFRRVTGMQVTDYYRVASYVASDGLRRPVEGLADPDRCGLFSAKLYEQSDFGQLARAFFRQEAQSPEDLRAALWGDRQDANESEACHLTLKSFRDRPILRTHDGRAIILDPRSFIERLSVGPLFQLVRAEPDRVNAWFTHFGDIFQEYGQDLLARIYPDAPGLVRRFVRNPKGIKKGRAQPDLGDALVIDGETALLFEMKAIWIPDSVVAPEQDGRRYLDEIRKRYVVADGTEGSRAKGVGQLARTIQHLSRRTWEIEGAHFDESARIIPVLLTHDPHMGAPVHSHVLAQEFAALMRDGQRFEDWSDFRQNGRRVAHLVVLTIDDLETLETSSNNFSIVDCLRDYADACPDRMTSVHNFLASSRYRPLLRANAWLAGCAVEIMDDLARLFSDASGIAVDA